MSHAPNRKTFSERTRLCVHRGERPFKFRSSSAPHSGSLSTTHGHGPAPLVRRNSTRDMSWRDVE